jgi:hypothetical protein
MKYCGTTSNLSNHIETCRYCGPFLKEQQGDRPAMRQSLLELKNEISASRAVQLDTLVARMLIAGVIPMHAMDNPEVERCFAALGYKSPKRTKATALIDNLWERYSKRVRCLRSAFSLQVDARFRSLRP